MLFIGAGVAHAIDTIEAESFYNADFPKFDFLSAFYYMIVTSSTLGYGDIYPIKTASRMITIVLIIAMVGIISDQLSKISQLMDNYSKYDTVYNDIRHIVIVGSYSELSLLNFLKQFYHEDHGNVKTRCIIVGEGYPTTAIVSILEDPRFEGKVSYLESPSTNIDTFNKANIAMAESVFILTN